MDFYIRHVADGRQLFTQKSNIMEEQNIIDNDETGEVRMKNSTVTLILGIASIPMCFCSIIPYIGILFVLIGLALPIIALIISKDEWRAYKLNPSSFHSGDAGNMKAGRICALVGLLLNGLLVLLIIGLLLVVGLSFAEAMSGYQ